MLTLLFVTGKRSPLGTDKSPRHPQGCFQTLAVDYGGKVAFDLRGSQVIVTRADEASHEDPAIAWLLGLLEKIIRTGQHLCNLQDGLVQAMQAATTLPVDLHANVRLFAASRHG